MLLQFCCMFEAIGATGAIGTTSSSSKLFGYIYAFVIAMTTFFSGSLNMLFNLFFTSVIIFEFSGRNTPADIKRTILELLAFLRILYNESSRAISRIKPLQSNMPGKSTINTSLNGANNSVGFPGIFGYMVCELC